MSGAAGRGGGLVIGGAAARVAGNDGGNEGRRQRSLPMESHKTLRCVKQCPRRVPHASCAPGPQRTYVDDDGFAGTRAFKALLDSRRSVSAAAARATRSFAERTVRGVLSALIFLNFKAKPTSAHTSSAFSEAAWDEVSSLRALPVKVCCSAYWMSLRHVWS